MIIEGEVDTGVVTAPFTSTWFYDPSDPLVVTVDFPGIGVCWELSLDLLLDAFTDPGEGLHGSGDVKVEITGESTFLYLSNGAQSAALKFPTLTIQHFLDRTSYADPDEVISRELDEFLETL